MCKALIVIDAINAIISSDSQYKMASCANYVKIYPEVIDNINKLITKFQHLDYPVIFIKLGFSPDYHDCPEKWLDKVKELGAFKIGTQDTEIYAEINTGKKDIFITKTDANPFDKTNLESELRNKKIDELIITGFATNNAVQLCGIEAKKKKFSATIVSDACGAATKENHEKALQELKEKGIAVLSTEVFISQINHSIDPNSFTKCHSH